MHLLLFWNSIDKIFTPKLAPSMSCKTHYFERVLALPSLDENGMSGRHLECSEVPGHQCCEEGVQFCPSIMGLLPLNMEFYI